MRKRHRLTEERVTDRNKNRGRVRERKRDRIYRKGEERKRFKHT